MFNSNANVEQQLCLIKEAATLIRQQRQPYHKHHHHHHHIHNLPSTSNDDHHPSATSPSPSSSNHHHRSLYPSHRLYESIEYIHENEKQSINRNRILSQKYSSVHKYASSSTSITTSSSSSSSPSTKCLVNNSNFAQSNRRQRLLLLVLVSSLINLLLCTNITTVAAAASLTINKRTSGGCGSDNNNNNRDCNRYVCDTESTVHTPMDYFLKPGQSIFTRPCKCQSDWKSHFCKNSAQYRLATIDNAASLPSICICRQFNDAGVSCQQFITQCFTQRRRSHETTCHCCFNQPGLYCNQLPCSRGQPEFGPKSNTTCVCHLPAFYPYYICNEQDLLHTTNSDHTSTTHDWRLSTTNDGINSYTNNNQNNNSSTSLEMENGSNGRDEEDSAEKMFSLFGFQMSPATAFTVVLSLLGVVALMTATLLVVRSCRLQQLHHQNDLRRNNAQIILLQQRADDDKYLP